jgi:hypothetical protein
VDWPVGRGLHLHALCVIDFESQDGLQSGVVADTVDMGWGRQHDDDGSRAESVVVLKDAHLECMARICVALDDYTDRERVRSRSKTIL